MAPLKMRGEPENTIHRSLQTPKPLKNYVFDVFWMVFDAKPICFTVFRVNEWFLLVLGDSYKLSRNTLEPKSVNPRILSELKDSPTLSAAAPVKVPIGRDAAAPRRAPSQQHPLLLLPPAEHPVSSTVTPSNVSQLLKSLEEF